MLKAIDLSVVRDTSETTLKTFQKIKNSEKTLKKHNPRA